MRSTGECAVTTNSVRPAVNGMSARPIVMTWSSLKDAWTKLTGPEGEGCGMLTPAVESEVLRPVTTWREPNAGTTGGNPEQVPRRNSPVLMNSPEFTGSG